MTRDQADRVLRVAANRNMEASLVEGYREWAVVFWAHPLTTCWQTVDAAMQLRRQSA